MWSHFLVAHHHGIDMTAAVYLPLLGPIHPWTKQMQEVC